MTEQVAASHAPGQLADVPDGYEAQTYWRDRPHGAGSWEVAYRKIGQIWWTVAWSDCGYAHSTDEYVRTVALERVKRLINITEAYQAAK